MVKCLLPVYKASTQFLVYVQSSFWYYTQHPKCIPCSFSSSKSKLISKYILNFPFNPSSKYIATMLAVCAMRLTVWWSLNFVVCRFVFKTITATSVKSLGHSSVSYMLLISCVTILGLSSPNSLSTSPGISSFF